MKNPWKKLSKINPQREQGNRQICNDIFHALVSGKFTGAEYKIILAVIDKTWGYNKTDAAISVKDFSKMTNLSSRMVKYSLKHLKSIRVLYSSPLKTRVQAGSPLNEYAVNKHYDTWILQGCNVVHPQSDKGAMDGKIGVQAGSPPPIKESIKEKNLSAFDNAVDPNFFQKPEKTPLQDGIDYLLTKKNRKLKGKRFETFMFFWDAFDYKKGKREAADSWYDIPKLTDSLVGEIVAAAKIEAAGRAGMKSEGHTPKMAQGWLSGARWEDEVNQKKTQPKTYLEIPE